MVNDKESSWKYLKVIFIVGFLILLFWPTIGALKYIAVAQIYDYYVDSIYSLTGLNKYIVKAIVIVLIIPYLYGLKCFLSFSFSFSFSPSFPFITKKKEPFFNKNKEYIGIGILVVMTSLYNLGLYHLTKNLNFSFSEGKILKYYARTRDGIKIYDHPGTDPVYGIPLIPVTPEEAENIISLEKGGFKPIDPEKAEFFNPITGRPQVWYYTYPDGTFEFYDKQVNHPKTGEKLQPVTKDIFFKWTETKKFIDKSNVKQYSNTIDKEKSTTVASSSQSNVHKDAKKIMEPSNKKRYTNRDTGNEESRLTLFKSGVSKNFVTLQGVTNVLLLVESAAETGAHSPKEVFFSHLKSDKVNFITSVFREDLFRNKGFFNEIFNGQTDLLKKSGIMSKADYLVIGKLNQSFKEGTELDNKLFVCNSNISFKVVNKSSEIVASESIKTVGPGYTEESALDRSMEILTEKFVGKISKY